MELRSIKLYSYKKCSVVCMLCPGENQAGMDSCRYEGFCP